MLKLRLQCWSKLRHQRRLYNFYLCVLLNLKLSAFSNSSASFVMCGKIRFIQMLLKHSFKLESVSNIATQLFSETAW